MLNNLRFTWLEIDMDNFRHNIKEIKKLLKPGTKILAIVKANSYGHGAVEISRACIAEGIDFLGVATISEVIELRKNRINSPIMVLGFIGAAQVEEIFRHDIIPTVYSTEVAKALNSTAQKHRKKIKIHIKVDTGMNRIGVPFEDAFGFIKWVKQQPWLIIDGVFSHFACADWKDKKYAGTQLDKFKKIIEFLKKERIRVTYMHMANSAGVLDIPDSHFNLVRPGIALYGLFPSPSIRNKVGLRPVMSLKSRIININYLPPGEGVSYSRTFMTKRPSVIATLPLGYADGISRTLSNKGQVLFRGRRRPLSGNICMDMMMFDATGEKDASIGEEAVIFGSQKGGSITADELAERMNTINYEIVSSISLRVPRVYTRNGKPYKVLAHTGQKLTRFRNDEIF